MERNVSEFLTTLTDEAYQVATATVTFSELNDDPAGVIAGSIAFAKKQLEADQLVSTRLDVTGFNDQEINIRLESSLLNLPFAYAKEIDKMLDADATMPVNLYMIIDSPAINVSKMRIDLASSVQAFLDDPESVTVKIVDWLREQIERLETMAAQAEESAKQED
ncbi:hypothetical protein [Furfurilactobacillus siliginis]|uniref:Uncharacterized protein n=1 Tax=Furfurilactobacillus siliginis TaxID=348151 RepID=A0A0R2L448_9LACO|nr:hypothetical protein [Furfurilactobacillus siliginis]KRN96459.1 hypothetical protein IV55_GL001431 [Furfurilactobacillus siliginis]GEK28908.1 hypothetical protein LSI01_12190 [Furfurilactobacillus siliginis]